MLGKLTDINIGYVQQQDVHLETSTVREALCFSAILRQPQSTSLDEKQKHVEDVIKVCHFSVVSEASYLLTGRDARYGRICRSDRRCSR
jgi:ABC-type multidrug transport system ATPase subunit